MAEIGGLSRQGFSFSKKIDDGDSGDSDRSAQKSEPSWPLT